METEKSGDAAGTRKDRIVCFIYCSSRNDDDFSLTEKQKRVEDASEQKDKNRKR